MYPVNETSSLSHLCCINAGVTRRGSSYKDENTKEVGEETGKKSEGFCVKCRRRCKLLLRCCKCNALNCKSCVFWCTFCPTNFKRKYIVCSNCYENGGGLVKVAARIWKCPNCFSSRKKRW